jgi:hypothetical protein
VREDRKSTSPSVRSSGESSRSRYLRRVLDAPAADRADAACARSIQEVWMRSSASRSAGPVASPDRRGPDQHGCQDFIAVDLRPRLFGVRRVEYPAERVAVRDRLPHLGTSWCRAVE